MESQEVLDTSNGVSELLLRNGDGDDLNVELLDDLDTMMEDIDSRLRIARMVSDSVIKGMVSAVEQEAEEKVKAKEVEIESLKRSLLVVNGDVRACGSFEEVSLKHGEMKESVVEEFKQLRKQIEGVRGGCKIKRNGSCHEMVGLGGILKEEYENGVSLEKTVDNLEMMMNDMFGLVDTMVSLSKMSLSEERKERESKGEVKDVVIEEAGSQNINLAEKFSNVSDLRSELESLTKLLPSTDSGHLISHGSFDVENAHGNPLRSQLSSRWEENGMSNESKPGVSYSYDANAFSHMNKEQLVKFFDNTILKLKREHEAEVHEMADNYISLKGKYLSERRSFVLPSREFEVLKKKIPEVVSKLDVILSESDEIIKKGDRLASLHTLFNENRQLRESLAVKKDEVKHLTSQLSAASEKKNKSVTADKSIEASTAEDVYKSVIKELNRKIQDMQDESELEIAAMQDIYEVLLGEAKNASIYAVEETRTESLFMQELLKTVLKETLTDVKRKFENLHKEYITATDNLVSLENKATGMEGKLIMEAEERVKLTNEVHLLRNLLEEKETLAKEELNNLRKQASWQETVMSKTNKELDEMSDKLSKAQERLSSDTMEINSLNQKLALAMDEIKTLSDTKNMVLALSEEKQSFLSVIEVKEKEHKKQMEAVVVLVDELSTKFVDFERRVTKDVLSNNARFASSRSQLSSLIKVANVLKSTGILYKQKLEKKCLDLQMAEDEVDLLGDEVETLVGLLEKIYIALDHYSPVLQHYPGVMEILELVRRELSGESLKTH